MISHIHRLIIKYLYLILIYTLFVSCELGSEVNSELKSEFKKIFYLGEQHSKSNLDSALYFFDKAEEVAKAGDYLWGIGIAYSGKGVVELRKREYLKSYLNYLEALKYLKKADTLDNYNLANINHAMAIIHYRFDDFLESISLRNNAEFYWNNCLNDSISTDIELVAEIRKQALDNKYYLARSYFQIDSLKLGMSIFKELLFKSKADRNHALKGRVLNGMGGAFFENGYFDSARYYYGQILAEEVLPKKYHGFALHNLGEVHNRLGLKEQSISLLKSAFDHKVEHNSSRSVFLTLVYLGDVYLSINDAESALDAYHQALSLHNNLDRPGMFKIYESISKAHSILGEEQLSITNLDLHKRLAETYELSKEVIDLQKERAEFYHLIERDSDYTGLNYPLYLAMILLTGFSVSIRGLYLKRKKRKKLLIKLNGILRE